MGHWKPTSCNRIHFKRATFWNFHNIFTARKRSLGQGYIFTPVCHSVHREDVHGCSRGACMVAPEGCAWFYLGVCAWFYLGVYGFSGGMHGFIWGACMVLFGEASWFYFGGMHGFIQGACMVLFGGSMHGFFSFFGYNEIRSMSGWYASYWNAFLFCVVLALRWWQRLCCHCFMWMDLYVSTLVIWQC